MDSRERIITIHFVFGLILSVAGVLKFYEIIVSVPGSDLGSWTLPILAEAELIIGAWLLAGRKPIQTHPWVIAILAGFWASNLFRGVMGQCSCGCFGLIAINPWIAMACDLIMIIIILRWRHENYSHINKESPTSIFSLCAMILTSASIFAVGFAQKTPVTVSGSAVWQGHPLANVLLSFRGPSIGVESRTDDRGRFRLPPIQSGRYTIFVRKEFLPERDFAETSKSKNSKAFVKPPRNHPVKSTSKEAKLKSESVYDKIEFVTLDVIDCTSEELLVELKK